MASTVGATTHSKGTFATDDGVELFEQSWEIESPKAAVVIVHGLGEHSARYTKMAARLNQEGYAVYTYDQRSHGNSPGKQGYVADFKPMPEDLEVFIGRVRSRLDGIPLFLMGHSMGGLVLASHVLRYQPDVKGLVFSSSALKVGDNVKPLLQKVSGLLSAIAPRLPVHQLDPAAISRDPEEVRKYEEDPLVHHGKMLARTGGELMAEFLIDWNIPYVFGLAGSEEVGFLDALVDRTALNYATCIHEQVAMAMADGYSRSTGDTSIVCLHSIAGAAYALGQLVSTYRDRIPVVVTAGRQATGYRGQDGFLEDANLKDMPKGYAQWSWDVLSAETIPEVLRRAFLLAEAPPGGADIRHILKRPVGSYGRKGRDHSAFPVAR